MISVTDSFIANIHTSSFHFISFHVKTIRSNLRAFVTDYFKDLLTYCRVVVPLVAPQSYWTWDGSNVNLQLMILKMTGF